MCNRLEELWIKLLLKLPGIFKEIDGTLPSVSLCQNIILVPRVIKKKIVFLLSSYSDKMRWERDRPKQLYALFIVKT